MRIDLKPWVYAALIFTSGAFFAKDYANHRVGVALIMAVFGAWWSWRLVSRKPTITAKEIK